MTFDSDEDVVKPAVFKANKDDDDFVLNEDTTDFVAEVPNTTKRLPSISDHVLNRFDIEASTSENADILDAHLDGVSAYDAGKLEIGFIRQANSALEASAESTDLSKSRKRKSIESVLETSDSVKFGDLTPFEQMLQKQVELEKQGKKARIVTEMKPSVNKILREQDRTKRKKEIVADVEEFLPSEDELSDDSEYAQEGEYESSKREKKKATKSKSIKDESRKNRYVKDDGNDQDYEARIRLFKAGQEHAQLEGEIPVEESYHELKNGYKISELVWNKLYKYQKTGIRWLHELHDQYVGGILADEMGLGKTIQIIVFLRSLAESLQESRVFPCEGLGPTLIVCPTTLMQQWVKELNTWFPLCRVFVFHSTGSHTGPKHNLLRKINVARRNGSVMITSYSTFSIEVKSLLKVDWHYVILDEGHKIRNPEAKTTLTLKEVRTPHRLILSGSPMQNNLKELWSLIDFVYPGRLGSLKDFTEKFAIPITQGGYANASSIQVRTAYKCACVLRDAINPYLLRRMKKDVEMILQLPEKTEQVLFCDITPEQRRLYKEYLSSKECGNILNGRLDPFVGLISLRKLCNHPDLLTGGPNKHNEFNVLDEPEKAYGSACRSGKMLVTQSLLKLWKKQCHKVLLFSQSKQMLTILEEFVILEGYTYLRMDGGTPISARQKLVEQFNTDLGVFIFLLTTRVGGLGVNLTGASRVLIFDPDWNPSTDAQARERAWRIGQNKAVTIYRLMSSGTIEEKIYQRQIFKQFLANRVLVDPKQRRFFKTNDLHELFTLADEKSDREHGTETAAIFSATADEVNRQNVFDKLKKEKSKITKKGAKKVKPAISQDDLEEGEIIDEAILKTETDAEFPDSDDITKYLSEQKRQELMEIAKALSKKLFASTSKSTEPEKPSNSKKKSKKSNLFDGKYDIPYLKKQKRYKDGYDDQKSREDQAKLNKEQDDYVLSKLLKNTSVHSALRHDQIVTGGASSADIQLIEDEANAVAKRASEVLKRSKKAHESFIQYARSQPKPMFGRRKAIAVNESSESEASDQEPTTSGNTEPSQFDGGMNRKNKDTGSDLLKAIRMRKVKLLEEDPSNTVEVNDEVRNYPSLAPVEPVNALGDRFEKLAEDIRMFFVLQNGQARTNEVLEKFKNRVAASDSYAFRSILKRLCTLIHGGLWLLKEEYK